jgi:hypothetical protein
VLEVPVACPGVVGPVEVMEGAERYVVCYIRVGPLSGCWLHCGV